MEAEPRMGNLILASLLVLAGAVQASASDTYVLRDTLQPGGHDRSLAAKRADGRNRIGKSTSPRRGEVNRIRGEADQPKLIAYEDRLKSASSTSEARAPLPAIDEPAAIHMPPRDLAPARSILAAKPSQGLKVCLASSL